MDILFFLSTFLHLNMFEKKIRPTFSVTRIVYPVVVSQSNVTEDKCRVQTCKQTTDVGSKKSLEGNVISIYYVYNGVKNKDKGWKRRPTNIKTDPLQSVPVVLVPSIFNPTMSQEPIRVKTHFKKEEQEKDDRKILSWRRNYTTSPVKSYRCFLSTVIKRNREPEMDVHCIVNSCTNDLSLTPQPKDRDG